MLRPFLVCEEGEEDDDDDDDDEDDENQEDEVSSINTENSSDVIGACLYEDRFLLRRVEVPQTLRMCPLQMTRERLRTRRSQDRAKSSK